MIWLLLAALAAAPFVAERLRPLPGPSGDEVDLPMGRCFRRWDGPEGGPVVVAIHGLTTPSPVWDGIAAGLAARGFRVLRYDLFGRGFSARVAGRQDEGFFLRQLDELLAVEGVTGKVTLMGYSMGGSIAVAAAARWPERVERLVLLAPAGIEMPESGVTRFCRRVPFLGDWLFLALEPWRFRRRLRGTATAMTPVQLAQTFSRGFFPAVLSSLRGMLAARQEAEHRAIAAAGIPVLAIWGDADRDIPLAGRDRLAEWNPDARQEVVPGADHGLPYTHGAEVGAILREQG